MYGMKCCFSYDEALGATFYAPSISSTKKKPILLLSNNQTKPTAQKTHTRQKKAFVQG